MNESVSNLLAEKYGINAKPKEKIDCPFCGHRTFYLKYDDTLGKCFHPGCGRFIVPDSHDGRNENSLHLVLKEIFQDFHGHLLKLATITGHDNAYTYLVHERRVHPQVVTDSMLGAVPPRYDCTSKFDLAISEIEAAAKAEQIKNGSLNREAVDAAKHNLELLIEARGKFLTCTRGIDGWIAFFYTDAHHRIVAIRFREPYSKRILYFKPHKTIAGLFGHSLFAQNQPEEQCSLNEFLIIMEGEFNQLQLQSLTLRQGEMTRQNPGYILACSVGGVNNADYGTICETSSRPVFCYDNDSDGAGFALVDRARNIMSVQAFTTPKLDSDMDQFIRSFGTDHSAAWEAVTALVTGRKAFPRIYSGTGKEFLRYKTFIPRRLAEAIMERQNFKYSARVLWIYRDGVYRPEGELVVKREAQDLLGEERRENRIIESLRYIETATVTAPPDPDHRFINLRNGRLDWINHNLELHSPARFDVIQLPVAYDPTAPCPQFDRYLETTLTPEIIPLVEEIMGYCLIQDIRFEKAVMLVGCGSNGKSVFLDTINSLLGADNIAHVPLQDLEENRFTIAELFGKLANIVADIDDRALKSSSKFKMLVSGDRLKAERKFAQPFSFCSYARLIFSANSLPPSKDRTHAFYRRWLIIPFERIFEGKESDKELRARLRNELPGILNRALRGLDRLFSEGKFTEPQAVKTALEDYQRENDSVAAFVAAFVVEDTYATIAKQTFYGSYRNWCETEGLRPVAQKRIKSSLMRIFPMLDEVRPSSGRAPWHWVGIRLIEDDQAYADERNS
jgi:P4 family phage/plasmid primase-like protien